MCYITNYNTVLGAVSAVHAPLLLQTTVMMGRQASQLVNIQKGYLAKATAAHDR